MSTRPVHAFSTAALTGALVAVPALAALSGVPATAAPTPATAEIVGDTIVYTAAPGVDDDLIIGGDADGTMEFYGPSGAVVTSETCEEATPGSASCDTAGITRLVVYLLDGDDLVYADIPWNVPSLAFTIYGGPGNDSLGGNADRDDKLFGQGGDDYITGYSGNDVIRGGPGDDTLRGRVGRDYLRGCDGADTLYGGDGMDTLVGDRGPDVFHTQDAFLDYVFGGPGHDTVDGDGPGVDMVTGAEDVS